MSRPTLEAARRAIEHLARRDPRLQAALTTIFLGAADPDQRAAAARRAVAIIAQAADAAEQRQSRASLTAITRSLD
jgi:hypothetical protein